MHLSFPMKDSLTQITIVHIEKYLWTRVCHFSWSFVQSPPTFPLWRKSAVLDNSSLQNRGVLFKVSLILVGFVSPFRIVRKGSPRCAPTDPTQGWSTHSLFQLLHLVPEVFQLRRKHLRIAASGNFVILSIDGPPPALSIPFLFYLHRVS